MAGLTRLCPVGIPQHIIQRGNNYHVCFNSDEDVSACANWLNELLSFSLKSREIVFTR